MHYNVHIRPSGYNLTVQTGETVLAAALRQGYSFPYDCQNAICGTCRGRLLEGHVQYTEPFLLGLTDDERDQGYALFCSAQPTSDLVIEIEGAKAPGQLAVKKLAYGVELFEQITETIYRVILQPPPHDHIRYRAGQYIELLHPDTSPKPFSIANAPMPGNHAIELHIRHTPDNPYTTELLAEIRAQQKLHLQGPFGNCILQHTPAYPIIFLAGGTGLAPLKAIIEQALAENLQRAMYLYWGVRMIGDLYCHETLLNLAKNIPHFHYIPVLSGKSSSSDWQGRRGLVHEAVLQDHPNLAKLHVYASGPTELVFAALHAFKRANLNKALMYSDVFDYLTDY